MDKISVIVPIYNIEKYVRHAVDSIIQQTYTNLEIILVDDGSTDGSGAICDEYAAKDSRIKVIHQKNGGLSLARNVGIDMATGDFLGFVDGDDYIEPEMYQRLYDALADNDAQISICRFRYVGAKEERNEKIEICDEILSGKDILFKKRIRKHSWGWGYAWNKLYKKEIFDHLRYPVGKSYEDDFILHALLWDIQKVASISYVGYNYIQRSSSITNAYKVNRLDEVESICNRTDFYATEHVPSNVRHKDIIRGYYALYDVYAHADFLHEPFASRIKELNSELKKRNRKLRKEHLSLKQRALLMINGISPYCTWKCMQWIKKCLRRGRHTVMSP